MKNPSHSLRKIVSFLNNNDEDGGFWLPNIQRSFVWSEEKICRLFDSILRKYPISTLLIWKTKGKIRCRRFIDNYTSDIRIKDFYIPENDKKKCLVLDGQQRLQSLFIGLCGSYENRELYLNILSGEVSAPDDIKYEFDFLDKKQAQFPWIKFKDIVYSNKNYLALTHDIIRSSPKELDQKNQEKISEHIALVCQTFHADDGISYQELDSIENTELYKEDDVVEIFIRANSGGTPLSKSDLLFSLLSSSWDSANSEMEMLLSDLNKHGFNFNRDFVLKTCLTLLKQGARYEISKFRKTGIRDEIETKWNEIVKAIKSVLDFIRGKTFVRCHKALPSYLVLIPIVYFRYHYKNMWDKVKDLDSYLLRSLLAGAFSGTPDQLIDDCIHNIDDKKVFDVNQIFDIIRSKGRSLELTEDRFFQINYYGSDFIHILFNIWYKDFNYTPAYDNNLPQTDHIFPQSILKSIKIVNPDTGRKIMKYNAFEINQLPNCMLLTQQENGAGGKSDIPPDLWFKDKSSDYLDMHLIPKDNNLWKIENYENFVVERKKLIKKKFKDLLV